MNIYVGNLSYKAKDEDLRVAFESYGEVVSAKVITDKYSGDSKGFGFVEMPVQKEAMKAIEELNGGEVNGSSLVVNEARERSKKRGGNRNKGGWQNSKKRY